MIIMADNGFSIEDLLPESIRYLPMIIMADNGFSIEDLLPESIRYLPTDVKAYNQFMDGTDKNDQLSRLQRYRRHVRWPMVSHYMREYKPPDYGKLTTLKSIDQLHWYCKSMCNPKCTDVLKLVAEIIESKKSLAE